MSDEWRRHDYRGDRSADLNLTQAEATSLAAVLREKLSDYVKQGHTLAKAHPTSHIATLAALLDRVDSIKLGRKTWNLGR